jgi:hypothetical protein
LNLCNYYESTKYFIRKTERSKLNMKYKQWLKNRIEETDPKAVQLRMMTSGNQLTTGSPLKYGIYFAGNEQDDILDAQRNAGIYSAIGGGSIPQADIEFFVRGIYLGKSRVFSGYRIGRQHGDEWRDRKLVWWSPTLQGADKIAYETAHKTATRLSEDLGVNLVDLTPQDIAEFSEFEEQLKLEDRVFNYECRMGK